MDDLTLIKNEIDGVAFEVTIAPYVKVCKLIVEDCGDCFISDVDLAQVIRAITTSESLDEVKENLQGIWREDEAIAMVDLWINYWEKGEILPSWKNRGDSE